MRYKTGAVKEAGASSKCRHYWRIESPKGPTSRGVCKLCGEEKDFYNSWRNVVDNEPPNNSGKGG